MYMGSAVFGMIGIVLLLYCINAATRALQSEKWPTAPAKIVVLREDREAGVDGDVLASWKVRYVFQIGDFQHLGSRVFYGDGFFVPRSTFDAAPWDQLAIGQVVEISYDPENPDESVIQTGISKPLWHLFSLSLIFIAMSVLLLSRS